MVGCVVSLFIPRGVVVWWCGDVAVCDVGGCRGFVCGDGLMVWWRCLTVLYVLMVWCTDVVM